MLTWPGGTTPFPWDRLDGEPEEEYSLMRLYIDLGPQRTLPRLAEITGESEDRLRTVARTNRWDLRVGRYEDYLVATTSQYMDQLSAAQHKESERLADTLLVDQLGKLAVQIHNEHDSLDAETLLARTRALSSIKRELRSQKKRGENQDTGKVFHFHLAPQRLPESSDTVEVESIEIPVNTD